MGALTEVRRYSGKPIYLANGQTLYLPGSSVFQMPHGIPPEIVPLDVDSVQRYPLGTKLVSDDNIFRYVEGGGTIGPGKMVQAEAPDAAHDDLDPTGTATDTNTNVAASVAIGSRIISIATSITLVKDEYAGGLLTIETDTGVGYAYPIEANEATSAAANALIRLKWPLKVALNSTSDVKLTKSRWKEVIIAPTTLTGVVVGAAAGSLTDGVFGWVCTKGPWTVLTNGTVVIGEPVVTGVTTAGAVTAWTIADTSAVELPLVGHVLDIGPTTEYSVINLMLDA